MANAKDGAPEAARVFLKVSGQDAQTLIDQLSREEGISFHALLVNAGKRFDSQLVSASGEKDGKPVVLGTIELIEKLAEDVRKYRATRLIRAAEAAGEISAAERELRFHKEKNPRGDFSEVESRIDAARAALRPLAFVENANCRSVTELLGDVQGDCRKVTLDNKVAHVRDLAASCGMETEAETELVSVLARTEFRDKVNAVGALIKKLYGLGGKTSETRAREVEREDRGGGRNNPYEPSTRRGTRSPKWRTRS